MNRQEDRRRYRPEIDGLRAIAVLGVLVFHAGLPQVAGGYLGVDVFFVISGYLITAIIVDDLDAGRFSFAAFYQRRVRRLLPALLAMLVVTVPFAWFWMLPSLFRDYAQSLMATVLSYSNIHFWTKSGYFAPDQELAPLLHTWSLAVEEQFYLVFPLVCVLLWRTGTGWKRRSSLFLALAIASLLAGILLEGRDAAGVFYLLPTRMWELLAGAMASEMSFATRLWRDRILSLVGLAAVLASMLLFAPDAGPASLLALGPVLGTVLMLLFARKGTPAAFLLSRAPIRGIGLISYSVYLWHQPILALARIRLDATGPAVMAALLLLSLAVGYLSWRYVEQPFRRRRADGSGSIVPSRRLNLAAATLSGCLALFGLAGNLDRGIPERLPDAIQQLDEASEWSRNCLFNGTKAPDFPVPNCIFNGRHAGRYVLWGDSIAASLAPELAAGLDRDGIALEQLSHSRCAPILGIHYLSDIDSARCDAFNRKALAEIAAARPDTVVLVASWQNFLSFADFSVDGTVIRPDDTAKLRIVGDGLARTVGRLQALGTRVVLVYPHPYGQSPVPNAVAAQMMKGEDKPDIFVAYAQFVAESGPARAMMDRVTAPGIVRVRPETRLCIDPVHGCALAVDGKPLLADFRHFTDFGAQYMVAAILDELKMAGGDSVPPAMAPKDGKGPGW